jgi:hypothetical protein
VSRREPYTIQTTYYEPTANPEINLECQINLARHPRSAVLRAIDHMQMNTYGAVVCEVFDTNTCEVHATIKREIGSDDLLVSYGRDPMMYTLGGPPPRKKHDG